MTTFIRPAVVLDLLRKADRECISVLPRWWPAGFLVVPLRYYIMWLRRSRRDLSVLLSKYPGDAEDVAGAEEDNEQFQRDVAKIGLPELFDADYAGIALIAAWCTRAKMSAMMPRQDLPYRRVSTVHDSLVGYRPERSPLEGWWHEA